MRGWLVQRVTAVYMLLFIAFFLIHFVVDPPQQYAAWRAWLVSPGVRIATVVFFAALLAHAWAGLRVVITDYIHATALRVCLLGLTGLGLAALGAWILRILWLRRG